MGDGVLSQVGDGYARPLPYFTNCPIFSFKNFASAGLLAAPAVWPHNDGIGISVTPGMNCDSYRASPTGKYMSVSDGMYNTGTRIDRSAVSISPPNPGVSPTL